MGDFPV